MFFGKIVSSFKSGASRLGVAASCEIQESVNALDAENIERSNTRVQNLEFDLY